LKSSPGQAIITIKNREINILIIYAVWTGHGEAEIRSEFWLSKNREINILIIYAPPFAFRQIKKSLNFLSRIGRKSEGKRGVGGGCGNVVNP
jgi:hypothetical protein